MKKKKIFVIMAVVLLLVSGTAEVFAQNTQVDPAREDYQTTYEMEDQNTHDNCYQRYCVSGQNHGICRQRRCMSEQDHGTCRQGYQGCRIWCD